MQKIEMQGPIKCSVQLDTLGRDCYERQEGLYLYNGCVSVPPLEMIDDLASFAICGPQSIVNAKIESKKLNARGDQSLMDLDSIRDPISPEASRLVDGADSIVSVSLNLI